jgi:hypothetical protein
MTKTTAVSTEDTVARLLDVDGHAGAAACSGVSFGWRKNGEEERGRRSRERGMDCGG